MHSQVFRKEFEDDQCTYIEWLEKAAGKFAYRTVKNLHTYVVLFLNRLIHGLLKVSKRLYETKLWTKSRWDAPPNLLSFKQSDLMRCRCASREEEILKIYQSIEKLSQDSEISEFKIYRIKNRLKRGTRDVVINVLFKEKYLC